MTPDRADRVRALFERALDRPESERGAYLDRVCGDDVLLRTEVAELLREDASPSPLDATLVPRAAWNRAFDEGAEDTAAATPARIDGYRVLSVLGHGAASTVYEVEQETPRRRVALKLLRAPASDPSVLARFRREADALARLDHPFVARIHGAGIADLGGVRHPYLLLEKVSGVSLDRFVAERAPERRERQDLLRRIAEGVAHAHVHGVVHRDLKPSNVLVDEEGDPRVVDFGVARLLHTERATTHTATGQILGTLPYLSPEQASGRAADVDARGDVYALGVLGFELLSGRLPLRLEADAFPEALRRIVLEESPRLGDVDRTLGGDVETVIAKALRKRPADRYRSAVEFARDLRALQDGEPIAARPETRRERAIRFVRRHRALAAGTVATILALAAGLTVALLQVEKTREQAEIGDAARRNAEQVSQFLQEMILAVDPDDLGRDVRLVDVLDRAVETIPDAFSGADEAAARVHTIAGEAYRRLGMRERATAEHRAALARAAAAFGDDDPRTHAQRRRLASTVMSYDTQDEARALLERVAGDYERRGSPSADEAVRLAFDLARLDEYASDSASAADRLLAVRPLAAATDMESWVDKQLADSLVNLGRLEEAEPILTSLLAACERRHGRGHNDTRAAAASLAQLRLRQGRPADALPLLERNVDTMRTRFEPDHPDLLVAQVALGDALMGVGRHSEAAGMLRAAAEGLEARADRPIHPYAATARKSLAALLVELGRHGEARVELERFFEIAGDREGERLEAKALLGSIEMALGEYERAEATLRETILALGRRYGEEHPMLVQHYIALGDTLAFGGKKAEGEAQYRESLTLSRRVLGEDHPQTANAKLALGRVILFSGRPAEAAPLLRDALARFRETFGDDHPQTISTELNVAELELRNGDEPAGIARLTAAIPRLETAFGLASDQASWALGRLVEALIADDRFDDAIETLTSGIERRGHALGPDHPVIASLRAKLEALEASRP